MVNQLQTLNEASFKEFAGALEDLKWLCDNGVVNEKDVVFYGFLQDRAVGAADALHTTKCEDSMTGESCVLSLVEIQSITLLCDCWLLDPQANGLGYVMQTHKLSYSLFTDKDEWPTDFASFDPIAEKAAAADDFAWDAMGWNAEIEALYGPDHWTWKLQENIAEARDVFEAAQMKLLATPQFKQDVLINQLFKDIVEDNPAGCYTQTVLESINEGVRSSLKPLIEGDEVVLMSGHFSSFLMVPASINTYHSCFHVWKFRDGPLAVMPSIMAQSSIIHQYRMDEEHEFLILPECPPEGILEIMSEILQNPSVSRSANAIAKAYEMALAV